MIGFMAIENDSQVELEMARSLSSLSGVPLNISEVLDLGLTEGLKTTRSFAVFEFQDVLGLLRGHAPDYSAGRFYSADGPPFRLAQVRQHEGHLRLSSLSSGHGVDRAAVALALIEDNPGTPDGALLSLTTTRSEGFWAWMATSSGARLFWPTSPEQHGLASHRFYTPLQLWNNFRTRGLDGGIREPPTPPEIL